MGFGDEFFLVRAVLGEVEGPDKEHECVACYVDSCEEVVGAFDCYVQNA